MKTAAVQTGRLYGDQLDRAFGIADRAIRNKPHLDELKGLLFDAFDNADDRQVSTFIATLQDYIDNGKEDKPLGRSVARSLALAITAILVDAVAA